jgi:hypothetical protein
MGLARSFLKGIKEKVIDRYSEKLVSSLADTSSDAPTRFAAPKRDVYDQMAAEGKIEENKKADR